MTFLSLVCSFEAFVFLNVVIFGGMFAKCAYWLLYACPNVTALEPPNIFS